MWISDGTTLNTAIVRDINTGTGDANAQRLQPDGSRILFAADDGINGEAVWVADTAAGTATMLADVSPTSTDRIFGLTLVPPQGPFNSQAIFFNNSAGTTGGVYITNPVGTGATQLSDLRPVELNPDGDMFLVVGSSIYFVTDDGINGEEIWVIENQGQAELAFDVNPGGGGSNPRELIEFQDDLYFVATSGDQGRELHRILTFDSEVEVVADIDPGTDSSNPDSLIISGNRLFFTASDGTGGGNFGRELYATDGSAAIRVADIRSGGIGSNPAACPISTGPCTSWPTTERTASSPIV